MGLSNQVWIGWDLTGAEVLSAPGTWTLVHYSYGLPVVGGEEYSAYIHVGVFQYTLSVFVEPVLMGTLWVNVESVDTKVLPLGDALHQIVL